MTKEELAGIFKDTLDTINVGGYENMKGEWIDLEQNNLAYNSKFFPTLPALRTQFPTYDTKIYVDNKDTFQKAQEMGSDVAVLNMASYSHPGGGVAFGSKAQEEELCRRSNLYLSLCRFHPTEYEDAGYEEPSKEGHYPIPYFGGVYSPSVSIIRSYRSYSFLDKPIMCNVISVPAVKRPVLDRNGNMIEKYEIIMRGKIRAIFRIALMYGHTKLVLGAMGCGAYGCPPKHVAKLFKEVLEEKEFKNHFKEICFAILEDQNSPRGGNIKPFKEVFPDHE